MTCVGIATSLTPTPTAFLSTFLTSLNVTHLVAVVTVPRDHSEAIHDFKLRHICFWEKATPSSYHLDDTNRFNEPNIPVFETLIMHINQTTNAACVQCDQFTNNLCALAAI